MIPSAVEMHKVNKWFGDNHVLRDVNLTVEHGKKVVVCGPSGSGKSTLVRCVNGLEKIQEGKLLVQGYDITNDEKSLQKVRPHIGMVFQQFNLFPHMTALGNCTLALRWVKGLTKKQARERAQACLEAVHIEDLAYQYPLQLSGGQQQRVAIARALSIEPSILIFDEPTSALDPEMVKEVLDVMEELASEKKVTILCVTHEMGFARNVADEVIFMDEGQIVEKASPDNFFEKTKTKRAKTFLSQILQH